jgi:hypothetical protein
VAYYVPDGPVKTGSFTETAGDVVKA